MYITPILKGLEAKNFRIKNCIDVITSLEIKRNTIEPISENKNHVKRLEV